MSQKLPISGAEFEQLMENDLYQKYKNKAFMEHNFLFYGDICPSTVDLIAEFDLFIVFINGTRTVFEFKARDVTDYHLYKLDIQVKRTGLIRSNVELYSTNKVTDELEKLAFNLGIQLNRKNLSRASVRAEKPLRKYIESKLTPHDYDIYRKYHNAALEQHPGYYILLNNCWIPHDKRKQEILSVIKTTLKQVIPHTNGLDRKVLEFIYIKTRIIEDWVINNDGNKLITKDIINLIKSNSTSGNANIDKNLRQYKESIEKELGSKLSIDTKIPSMKKDTALVDYNNKPESFTNLYIVVGFDTYILNSLVEIIKELKSIHHFKKVILIHTTAAISVETATTIYTKLKDQIPIAPPLDYLEETGNTMFNPTEFISFINNLADQKSALLVTYIPKLWALLLHRQRENWKYFFFIDRPEYKSEKIDLIAFELKHRNS